MAIGTALDARKVDTGVASLTVDVAGEIPVQVPTASGDRRVCCFGDETATLLIDILKKEGDIIPGRIPTSFEQRVLSSGPRSDGRVVKVREVVIVTVDDNRRGLDFPRMESIRGLATNGQREAKCEETDSGHEREDDAEEAYLLSPGPLLLGCSDATSSE